jgi:hypothetical protein
MHHRSAKNIVGNTTRIMPAFVLLAFILNVGTLLFSQSSAITGPWSGQAQCQITVQGPYGYNHSETQTWTLNGGQPTMQGAMNILPATWSVTGQGSFQKTTGSQNLVGQWKTNATPISAPLALFIRASDGMLILKSWHSQLTAPGSVTGTQQMYINGVAQTPGAITAAAFEWQFPFSQVPSASTSISGSTTIATNGSVGPMQPGGSQGTASCTWNFAAGNSLSAGGSGNGQNPTGSGTGPTSNSGSPGGSTNPGAPGAGSGSTPAGGTTPTGSTGGGTPGTSTTGSSTPGAGTNPGGTPTGGGQNQVSPGVSRISVSTATLVGSCPAPPSSPGPVIARPYCLQLGQQNVALTLTAVPPFQWPQGTYVPSSISGLILKSASWSASSIIAVADVDPTDSPGPAGSLLSLLVSTGQYAGACCIIQDLGSPSYVVIPASIPRPTSPLVNLSTTSSSTGSVPVMTVTPNLGHPGQQNLQLTILGSPSAQPFQTGATVDLGGWGITVASVNVISPTKAVVVINIDPAAQSARVVSLTNPDGSGNLVVQGFTVGP